MGGGCAGGAGTYSTEEQLFALLSDFQHKHDLTDQQMTELLLAWIGVLFRAHPTQEAQVIELTGDDGVVRKYVVGPS